ncbi:hypothetical protein Tco_0649764, partial [Tanacetum coccineum]
MVEGVMKVMPITTAEEKAMRRLKVRDIRFLKNTGMRLTVNGNETIGFDKSKVECA